MIYDCFTFFNELELLELRLTELENTVDYFVIVESMFTHSGQNKPLFFEENAHRFERWNGRIKHVVVDDMPNNPDPWANENHQRRCILRGLIDAKSNDTIIISDLDEIPRADAIRSWSPERGPHKFEQMFCYYWVNCVGGRWIKSYILTYQQLLNAGDVETLRQAELPLIPNGGWHFSFLGGPASIAAKLEAYAHKEYNHPYFKDPRYLSYVTSLGIDLFNRPGMHFEFRPLDDAFPQTILKQRSKYAHLFREVVFHENWCADDQILKTCGLLAGISFLHGAVLEIGCWEGKSTIGLAHACFPELLYAIDIWQGNHDENADHVSVRMANERDVYAQFSTNVKLLTNGNVRPIRVDCHKFIADWKGPIKFVYIDASHDYESVSKTIKALIPHLIPGGFLCGDDFLSANKNRADLNGGVERAVVELLPGFQQIQNLWIWKKPSH